jgi:hypothetical protein
MRQTFAHRRLPGVVGVIPLRPGRSGDLYVSQGTATSLSHELTSYHLSACTLVMDWLICGPIRMITFYH